MDTDQSAQRRLAVLWVGQENGGFKENHEQNRSGGFVFRPQGIRSFFLFITTKAAFNIPRCRLAHPCFINRIISLVYL